MSLKKLFAVALAAALVFAQGIGTAGAATAVDLDKQATVALNQLYRHNPTSRLLASRAEAVLVFPRITKAGLVVGGQYGEGVLRKKDKSVGYYSSLAGSYGLQAGVQTFSYVLILMNKSAVEYVDRTGGWEIGAGPSVVLVDEGMAETITSTTALQDVYAFVVGQQGLMAGIGLQGAKISRIDR